MLTETHLGAGLPVLLAVRLGEGGAVGIFVHTGLGSGQRSTGSSGNLQGEGSTPGQRSGRGSLRP